MRCTTNIKVYVNYGHDYDTPVPDEGSSKRESVGSRVDAAVRA